MCIDCNDEFTLPTGGDGQLGPVGPSGPKGNGVRVSNGTPTVLTSDLNGDSYIDKVTGAVWSFTTGVWTNTGNTIIGPSGIAGYNGWSLVPSLVTTIGNYGQATTVIQVADWTGGTGTKPGNIGYYIGSTGLVPLLSNAVNVAGTNGTVGTTGPGYQAFTNNTINITGLVLSSPLVITTQAGLAYSAGARVRISNGTSNYIEGVVSTYSPLGTTLTVIPDRTVGAGAASYWTINLAGDVGVAAPIVVVASNLLFRAGKSITSPYITTYTQGPVSYNMFFDDDNTPPYTNPKGQFDLMTYTCPVGGLSSVNFVLENFIIQSPTGLVNVRLGIVKTPAGSTVGGINDVTLVSVNYNNASTTPNIITVAGTYPAVTYTITSMRTGNLALAAGDMITVRLFQDLYTTGNTTMNVQPNARLYNI